jgi:molybdate-binding protein
MSIVKLARFTSVGYDTVCYFTFDPGQGYTQNSEWVEVNFPPVRSDEVVQKQLAALELLRADVTRKFSEALKSIDDRKAELQAITYQPERK